MRTMYRRCPKHGIPAVGANGRPHKFGKCDKCRREEQAAASVRSRTKKAMLDTQEAKAARRAAGQDKRKATMSRKRAVKNSLRAERILTQAYWWFQVHPEFVPDHATKPKILPDVPEIR